MYPKLDHAATSYIKPVIKTCNCCGRTFTPKQWTALPYKGRFVDDVETLEFRDCPCESTLAIVVPKE